MRQTIFDNRLWNQLCTCAADFTSTLKAFGGEEINGIPFVSNSAQDINSKSSGNNEFGEPPARNITHEVRGAPLPEGEKIGWQQIAVVMQRFLTTLPSDDNAQQVSLHTFPRVTVSWVANCGVRATGRQQKE